MWQAARSIHHPCLVLNKKLRLSELPFLSSEQRAGSSGQRVELLLSFPPTDVPRTLARSICAPLNYASLLRPSLNTVFIFHLPLYPLFSRPVIDASDNISWMHHRVLLSISTLHRPPLPPLLCWLSLGVPLSSVADREHGWLTRQVMSLLMQMASPAPFSSLSLARSSSPLSLLHTNTHRGAKEPTPPDSTSTLPASPPPLHLPSPLGVLRYSWVKQYLEMFGGR